MRRGRGRREREPVGSSSVRGSGDSCFFFCVGFTFVSARPSSVSDSGEGVPGGLSSGGVLASCFALQMSSLDTSPWRGVTRADVEGESEESVP